MKKSKDIHRLLFWTFWLMATAIVGFGVAVWFAASTMHVPYDDLLAFVARVALVLGAGFLFTVLLAILFAYKEESNSDEDQPRH